jgi:hypothetical protein
MMLTIAKFIYIVTILIQLYLVVKILNYARNQEIGDNAWYCCNG